MLTESAQTIVKASDPPAEKNASHDALRQRLADDVDAFLAKGNRIEVVPFGVMSVAKPKRGRKRGT